MQPAGTAVEPAAGAITAAGAGWITVGRSTIVSLWPQAASRERADRDSAIVVNRMKDLLLDGSRLRPHRLRMQQFMVPTDYGQLQSTMFANSISIPGLR